MEKILAPLRAGRRVLVVGHRILLLVRDRRPLRWDAVLRRCGTAMAGATTCPSATRRHLSEPTPAHALGLMPGGAIRSQDDPDLRPPDVWHVLSPFEYPSRGLDTVWPKWARTSRTRLAVTMRTLQNRQECSAATLIFTWVVSDQPPRCSW